MAIIESVEDAFDGVKDAVGKNGMLYLGIGAVALFAISYLSQSKKGNEVTVVSGVTSYPDTVTNADVIIQTLQNSIDYSEKEIKETIIESNAENVELLRDTGTEVNDMLQATNKQIQESITKQESMLVQQRGDMNENFAIVNKNIQRAESKIQDHLSDVESSIGASHFASALQLEKTETYLTSQIQDSAKAKGK